MSTKLGNVSQHEKKPLRFQYSKKPSITEYLSAGKNGALSETSEGNIPNLDHQNQKVNVVDDDTKHILVLPHFLTYKIRNQEAEWLPSSLA